MPFTLAHAAAALPLQRATALPFCGLAVGTMSPDFEYFLRARPGRTIGHETWGILLMDLPLSLLVLALASWFVVPGLAALLPRRWAHFAPRLRAWSAPLRPGSGLGRLCIAIVIGAFSHILWDDFTHSSSQPTLNWLNWHVIDLGSRNRVVRLHDFMQLGSSALGITILGVAAARWYFRQAPSRKVTLPRRHRAVAAVLMASAAISIALINPFRHLMTSSSTYNFVVLSLVAGISTVLATLTLFGVLLRTTGIDDLAIGPRATGRTDQNQLERPHQSG